MKRKKVRKSPSLGWIVALRKKLNLTQVQFAERVGVAIRTEQSWEAAENPRQPRRIALRVLHQLKNDSEVL